MNPSPKYGNKKDKEFDSQLERFCHSYLKEKGFDFEFQKVYVLQESYKRSETFLKAAARFKITASMTYAKGKKKGKPKNRISIKNLLPIKMIVDFFIEGSDFDVIIDTKGAKTPDWLVKAKILELQLSKKEKPTIFFLPSSQKEVKIIVNEINLALNF